MVAAAAAVIFAKQFIKPGAKAAEEPAFAAA
jgi:hypothetical protein